MIDDPVFAEPWEAQAFAMTLALHRRGAFTWPEWAAMLAAQIAQAPAAPYYRQWLAALEAMVAAKGLARVDELRRARRAWQHAAERTPHGQPIALRDGDGDFC